MLWDLAEGKRLYSLDAQAIIHALCFSPNRYWLCAATQSGIKIWDLERWVGGQWELWAEVGPGKVGPHARGTGTGQWQSLCSGVGAGACG